MIQLLERKAGIRIIVFALLLTILAWLVPSNIGQANAETTEEPPVTLLEQTITGESVFTKSYGDSSFDLRAAAPGELTYASNNSLVATVSKTGIVTITGIGTATITITAAETPTYKAATKLVTIIVGKPEQTISGLSSFIKAYGDSDFNLEAEAPGILSYESSNPHVAAVTSYGRVSINGVGTATITIRAAETNQYAAATKLVRITVEKGGQVIKGDTSFQAVYGDEPFNLNQQAEGTLTYESKNPEVVTVSADGTVTIIGAGIAEIQITAAATSSYEAGNRTVRVIVEKGKQTISGATSFTKNYGNSSFSLGASAEGELSYESSNLNVATVSSSGTVTIKGPGTAAITITAAETSNYQQATKQVNVTVKVQKPKTVAIKSAKSSKEGQLTVSWKKVSGVSGYQVVFGQNKSCTSGKKVKTVSSKTSSITIKGLAKGTKYYAKVRAYKTISGKKYYGNYSKVKSAKTKGVKPLTAADLKKYQNKNFYKVNKDLDGVAVYFKKASGNKLKINITDGNLFEPDFGNHTWDRKLPITGTIHGNTLKFKDAQFYGAAVLVEGDGPQLVKMAKLSGTITFVNSKTIKLKITSGKNYTKYYSQQKKWVRLKPGKTITLKRSSNIDHQMGF